MPLNPIQLGADFEKVFNSKPPTAMKAAKALAQAYDKYASQALAGACMPTTPGNVAAMVPVLAAVMAPSPVPGLLELGWATAIALYWMTVVFVGPPVPPSVAPTVSVSISFIPPGPLLAVLMLPVPGGAGLKLAIACHAYTVSGQVASNGGPLTLV
jgi:hypothetical protein